MKSKAAGCGSISTVISSIVLLCVSSIMIMIIIIIIITIIIIIIDRRLLLLSGYEHEVMWASIDPSQTWESKEQKLLGKDMKLLIGT